MGCAIARKKAEEDFLSMRDKRTIIIGILFGIALVEIPESMITTAVEQWHRRLVPVHASAAKHHR
jgi:hypothetical protein